MSEYLSGRFCDEQIQQGAGWYTCFLGILFLMKNMEIFDPIWRVFNLGALLSRFWPALFLLLPGLLFHYNYFSGNRRNPGVLVPGGILLVLGLVFQFNMLFGGWDITWPLIIFSVAFGLFELYIFGDREKGLLIPVGILGGLSFLFFFSFSLSKLLSFNTGAICHALTADWRRAHRDVQRKEDTGLTRGRIFRIFF